MRRRFAVPILIDRAGRIRAIARGEPTADVLDRSPRRAGYRATEPTR